MAYTQPAGNYIEQTLRQWLAPLRGQWPGLYLVGGAVRDHLLARVPKDIDLACRDARTVARHLARERSAVVVPLEKKPDEPCYRVVDRQNSDNYIDIAELRGDTIQADLQQRDFTINAIAVAIEQGGSLGPVIDPLHGRDDLENRVVRVTRSQALVSDPLRMLRAPRLAAELDFTIDGTTLTGMRENTGRITGVSWERITAELLKLFTTPHSSDFVRMLDELQILQTLFPEIIPMKGCAQNSFHHLDVWAHSLAVLENCEHILNDLEQFFGEVAAHVRENLQCQNRVPLLKLAALLHDIGKPGTRDTSPATNAITFYRHDIAGEKMVAALLDRMRLSKKDQLYVSTLVAQHLHVLNLSRPDVKQTTKMRWFRRLGHDSIPLILLGMADVKGTLGPQSDEASRTSHLNWSRAAVAEYFTTIKKKLEQKDLISGRDLLAMGMAPGPALGAVLSQVRDARDAGQVTDRAGALRYAQQLLAGKVSEFE